MAVQKSIPPSPTLLIADHVLIEGELYAQDFQRCPVLDYPSAAPIGWWGFGWCFLCLFLSQGQL